MAGTRAQPSLNCVRGSIHAGVACMVAEADYVWGTGITEQQRLLKQIELYVPEATWLLDRLELAPDRMRSISAAAPSAYWTCFRSA
jgi:hypothetical protein